MVALPFTPVAFGIVAEVVAGAEGAACAFDYDHMPIVIGFDRSKKPNFSVKALQIAEEKQAVAQYGSSDSGASLGDILGEALKQKG